MPEPARRSCRSSGDEEGYYRNVNEDHRRHFEAMDVPLGTVGVVASA